MHDFDYICQSGLNSDKSILHKTLVDCFFCLNLYFDVFFNSTLHNHSTMLTVAGKTVFHQKKKMKILDFVLFIPD